MSWKTPGQTLDLNLDTVGVSVTHDGTVVFLDKKVGLMTTTILSLLYIVQRYQEHGGTIRAPIDPRFWVGVEGETGHG